MPGLTRICGRPRHRLNRTSCNGIDHACHASSRVQNLVVDHLCHHLGDFCRCLAREIGAYGCGGPRRFPACRSRSSGKSTPLRNLEVLQGLGLEPRCRSDMRNKRRALRTCADLEVESAPKQHTIISCRNAFRTRKRTYTPRLPTFNEHAYT